MEEDRGFEDIDETGEDGEDHVNEARMSFSINWP